MESDQANDRVFFGAHGHLDWTRRPQYTSSFRSLIFVSQNNHMQTEIAFHNMG